MLEIICKSLIITLLSFQFPYSVTKSQLAVKKSCLKYSRNKKTHIQIERVCTTYRLRGFAQCVYPEYIMKATKDSRFQLEKQKKNKYLNEMRSLGFKTHREKAETNFTHIRSNMKKWHDRCCDWLFQNPLHHPFHVYFCIYRSQKAKITSPTLLCS